MNHWPAPPAGTAAGDDPLAGLLHILAGTRPGADVELIRRAYEIAAYWHRGQQRKSGDPYITHPIAVATILAETGTDDQSLCAALLHDTVEGTPCTLAAFGAGFGAEIASLVAGVMALNAAERGGIAAAGSGDTRVFAIKQADRLHNMLTLAHLPRATQVQRSRQTLEVLVPLARRLCLDTISVELESLASGALERHGLPAATSSGRVLGATTALLPAAARVRWREEWLGELSVLPARRERVTFAVQTLRGIVRLAVTLHRPAGRQASSPAMTAQPAQLTAAGLRPLRRDRPAAQPRTLVARRGQQTPSDAGQGTSARASSPVIRGHMHPKLARRCC